MISVSSHHLYGLASMAIGFEPKLRDQGSAQPPAKKTAGQIEKETEV
jgi:hypothetical protein